MAGRLTHAAALCVLALCLARASACASASEAPAGSLPASLDAAAAVATGIVRSLNAAVVDAYVLRTLASGGAPSAAEPCIAADNRLSRRPTALANPPYAEASIVQRDRLVRVLDAYALLVAAISRDTASGEAQFAAADFQRAALALSAAANVHAQGDLFVEDRAAALAAVAVSSRDARDATALAEMVVRANPLVQQLIALARADASKRRLEAIAAAQAELRALLAYGALPPPATAAPGAPSTAAPAAVACSKPLVPGSAAAAAPQAAAIEALAPGLRSRAQTVRERAAALGAVDLNRWFEALHDEAAAASALPLRRSNVSDAAMALQREAASVGKDGTALTLARL